MIKILSKMLRKFADDIDAGHCNMEEEDIIEALNGLERFNTSKSHMSKYQACRYLNVSRATFDRMVADGKIQKGRHIQGFKELSWSKSELDKAKK